MNPIAECCADAVAFSYRSMDRLVLNAYIPTLQTPAAMAVFFRQVQRKPILAGKVFKDLTDRFVADVMHFAQQRRIPVLRVTDRTRPGEVAQKALKAAGRAGRFGVVAIVVHQESARVFASTHAGGRATNYRVKEDRRLVNHYYFYLRDKDYGEGFVRRSSYPPFQTPIWMNAHGYLAAQLRRRRIDFRTDENCIVEVADPAVLQNIAEEFDAALVERIARRWLAMTPDPLTPQERAAGYPTRLSIYQAEFCDNVVFHKTQVLNRIYEPLLKDQLHLSRLDMVKVLFDRRITRRTLTERLGVPAEQVTVGRIGYELRKLRGKGLVRKAAGRNLYTLTDLGHRVAIYFTKLHQRVLTPLLDSADRSLRSDPTPPSHSADRALQRLNAELDALVEQSGLKHAA